MAPIQARTGSPRGLPAMRPSKEYAQSRISHARGCVAASELIGLRGTAESTVTLVSAIAFGWIQRRGLLCSTLLAPASRAGRFNDSTSLGRALCRAAQATAGAGADAGRAAFADSSSAGWRRSRRPGRRRRWSTASRSPGTTRCLPGTIQWARGVAVGRSCSRRDFDPIRRSMAGHAQPLVRTASATPKPQLVQVQPHARPHGLERVRESHDRCVTLHDRALAAPTLNRHGGPTRALEETPWTCNSTGR